MRERMNTTRERKTEEDMKLQKCKIFALERLFMRATEGTRGVGVH